MKIYCCFAINLLSLNAKDSLIKKNKQNKEIMAIKGFINK